MKRRNDSSVLPWLVLLAVAGFWGWLLLRSDRSQPAIASQSVVQIEVTRERVVTPTRTPTPAITPTTAVVVVTATWTPSPAVPYCDQAESGQACWQVPVAATATAVPTCAPANTRSSAVLCVKPDSETTAKEATG